MPYNPRRMQPNAKIVELYRIDVSPLLPGDLVVIMPIEIPLQRFRELTVCLPEFITLIPETVFQYVLKNINGTQPSFEYILVNIMGKVKDDFAFAALPEDPLVLRLAEVAIGALIYEVQGMIHHLGLLDNSGLFHYKLAFMNQFEAVLYDNRLRAAPTQTQTTVGTVQLGPSGGLG